MYDKRYLRPAAWEIRRPLLYRRIPRHCYTPQKDNSLLSQKMRGQGMTVRGQTAPPPSCPPKAFFIKDNVCVCVRACFSLRQQQKST